MIKCEAIGEKEYLVEALDTYKEHSIADNVLGFVPNPGFQFKVTKERLEVLLGKNGHGLTFVKVIEEPKEEKVEKKPVKKKRTRSE